MREKSLHALRRSLAAMALVAMLPFFAFADEELDLSAQEDGEYTIAVSTQTEDTSKVKTPAEIRIENGEATVRIEWYMKQFDTLEYDGEIYRRVEDVETTAFDIPLKDPDAFIDIHCEGESGKIDYTLHFMSRSFRSKKEGSAWNIIPYGLAGALGGLLLYKGIVGMMGRGRKNG